MMPGIRLIHAPCLAFGYFDAGRIPEDVMPKFNVTYEIWDEAAVEAGEARERGFEIRDATLREAVKAVLATRTSQVDGVESVDPSDSRIEHARWFTVTNGREFLTGAQEQRSLHVPEGVTGSSRRRIARLVGMDVPAPEPEQEATGPRM